MLGGLGMDDLLRRLDMIFYKVLNFVFAFKDLI